MTTPFRIGFLLFDDLTQLDFTGPLQVLSRMPGAEIHLAAKTLDPVSTDCGPFILPTTTLTDCPQLDLLCIPGGFGIDGAMVDAAIMDFVRLQSAKAKYVTSVCTGSFVLGAAGLLQGKRATTHWSYHDELVRVGAIPVRERVVRDGNLFTGGGVTAGIDFALTIVRDIAGQAAAESIQLGLEYDPGPPVDSGSPDKASPPVKKAIDDRFEPRLVDFRKALAQALEPVAD
jgi:cyclohexyl-isocyanide hydratase